MEPAFQVFAVGRTSGGIILEGSIAIVCRKMLALVPPVVGMTLGGTSFSCLDDNCLNYLFE